MYAFCIPTRILTSNFRDLPFCRAVRVVFYSDITLRAEFPMRVKKKKKVTVFFIINIGNDGKYLK